MVLSLDVFAEYTFVCGGAPFLLRFRGRGLHGR